MKPLRSLFVLFLAALLTSLGQLYAAGEDIRWLLHYDGKALPAAPWVGVGKPNAKLEANGLRLIDADKDYAHYRAPWKPGADEEIIVEVTVKVDSVTGSQANKTASSLWPWRDGAPVSVLVSDGRHQEGLVLFATQAASHTDRFIPMDTTIAIRR